MKKLVRGFLACTAIAFLPSVILAQTPLAKIEEVFALETGLKRVFFGRVVARQTVDFAFQVSGQIVEFPVEEGTLVPSGDLVAKLDQEPFELALEEAKAQNDQARRTLERYEKLAGSSVSETTVEDAATQVELTGIAVRNAERAFSEATLNAPFEALVAARLVPNFSTVAAGTPVVRLHDMSDLRIEINVPEILFQRAGRDPDVDLYAEFPFNDGTYPLEIREFNAETAQVGQTYSITLGMSPPDELVVLPGSSAKVTAVLNTGVSRIVVPASAVVIGNDNSASVMVFEPAGADEGSVTRTIIEIAPTDDGKVEVISGLEPNQEFVAIGAGELEDGATVRRFVGFGN